MRIRHFLGVAVVLNSKAPLFALFGAPFVLIGLFFVVGRFFLDAWLRAKTCYAVTDRRILIARSGRYGFADFKALRLDQLQEASLRELSDGRGTIIFGRPVPDSSNRGAANGAMIGALSPTAQFIGIDDARHVYDLIQKQADTAAHISRA